MPTPKRHEEEEEDHKEYDGDSSSDYDSPDLAESDVESDSEVEDNDNQLSRRSRLASPVSILCRITHRKRTTWKDGRADSRMQGTNRAEGARVSLIDVPSTAPPGCK